tara:strand:- start:1813 stop:2025 length:213 start_codon:yes stop_codon:yes gene_type:complete
MVWFTYKPFDKVYVLQFVLLQARKIWPPREHPVKLHHPLCETCPKVGNSEQGSHQACGKKSRFFPQGKIA